MRGSSEDHSSANHARRIRKKRFDFGLLGWDDGERKRSTISPRLTRLDTGGVDWKKRKRSSGARGEVVGLWGNTSTETDLYRGTVNAK